MKQLENFYHGKNVLVTGGAGFIGSHLVERLVELGARVTVLDNFSAGKLSNLQTALTRVNLLYSDITTPYSTMKATNNKDYVFHLAAFVSVPRSIANPAHCYKTNVEGTLNLLEGCKQNNVKAFIFSSSSAVYGNKNKFCKEEDQPNPESPYAQSKLEGEKLCKKYAKESSLNTASLRYFNVYGERQNPHGDYAAVVAKFKQNIILNKPLTIYGDGMQTRDFINVAQVVEANLKVALLNNIKGDIFNVGSGKSMNLFELIEHLEKELNLKSSKITFASPREGDVLHSQADCNKYKKILSQLS